MITLNKIYQITGGQGANYTFSSNGNITFSNQSGTVDTSGIITTDIVYNNLSDFAFPIVLTVIKDGECTTTESFTYSNPCNSFSAAITNDGLTFNAQVIGGTAPYTYEWQYDIDVFNTALTTNPSLNLVVKDNSVSNSPITLTVVDDNGCEATSTFNYFPDNLDIGDLNIQTVCLNNDYQALNGLTTDKVAVLNLATYTGTTFNFSFDGTLLSVEGTNIVGIYDVYVKDTFDGVATISVTGTDSSGVDIVPFNVSVTALDCSTNSNTTISTINVDLCSNPNAVDLATFFPTDVDYTTFEFLPNTNQSLLGGVLSGERVVLQRAGSSLDITDLATLVLTESVNYQISSDTTTYFGSLLFNANCPDGPTVLDGTVCSTCETALQNISIASLVTGTFDPSTITVINAPTDGTLTVNNNGTFTYIQNNVLSVVDQFDFTVKDFSGQESNQARIYISRSCAGLANTTADITCQPKAFNLNDIADYTYYANGGATWIETTNGANTYTSQGGTISGGIDGTVDFSSITPGTYNFELQLDQACSAIGGSTVLTPGNYITKSFVNIIVDNTETITIDNISHIELSPT